MLVLLDTSILVRQADAGDPDHLPSRTAVDKLQFQGHELLLSPQVLAEFHSVTTRPLASNGLGLSSMQATALRNYFEQQFAIVCEDVFAHRHWKQIVDANGVVGKTVHDARLVAIGMSNNVSAILTFNVSHFTTLCQHVPGLRVIDPNNF